MAVWVTRENATTLQNSIVYFSSELLLAKEVRRRRRNSVSYLGLHADDGGIDI
jgi:hypothetical protein